MTKPALPPLDVYLPTTGRGQAVLVIHSWWGLTDSFRSFGRTLADEGLVVGLADLFNGRTASNAREAKRLRRARRREPMYKTLVRNINELQELNGAREDVGVVGFSMGGHWAVWLSQRPELPIGATVLYYAARAGSFRDSHSSFLAHFAQDDPWVSDASRRKMESEIMKAGLPYTVFEYAGIGHWFAETDRQGDYVPDAAALAFGRTLQHLRETLGTCPS